MVESVLPSLILYAKEPERLAQFYSAVLHLTETERADDFITLAAPSYSLVLVRVRAQLAAQIDIASPPRRRENVALKLAFPVADLAAARAAADAHGGIVDLVKKPWTFQGAMRIDCVDPEGNVIQLASLAKPN